MVQRILHEVEAEIEARNWEKRNSDIVCEKIKQEFDSGIGIEKETLPKESCMRLPRY